MDFSRPMKIETQISDMRFAKCLVLMATVVIAAGAGAAPPIDEKQLLDAGFKVLVATNKVQEDWVRGLAPGKIRAMQRTGKKYFIYPDAAKNQIFVGGPKEYQAYVQLHPEHRVANAEQAAKEASAYRGKQDKVTREATAIAVIDAGWQAMDHAKAGASSASSRNAVVRSRAVFGSPFMIRISRVFFW